MKQLNKHSVLGIDVNAIDYVSAVSSVMAAAQSRAGLAVTALAVHGVMTGVLDREHNYRLNQFDLVCPDGQPVRWALNLLHRCRLKDRVYGPELTLRLCAAAAEQRVPIFLFGGTSDLLSALQKNLMAKFPALEIAGTRPSAFRQMDADERQALAAEINASGAGLCFVGLGCPRQETFAYEMRDRISMPLIAVGAAFAFHAGQLQQAPPWMQRHGLEWWYRFTREPKRLWKRYLYLNPLYLTLLMLQKMGLYRGRTDQGIPPKKEWMFG